ncbi:class I SAM-dependent methyltransferase [Shewanella sp. VB17]|uniref:class I SAM-dependent methyltransferase n=1 Tax=Shewanella sp. VB17 TaxID=2739432 RepID=UPI0015639E02|nr:class I SAM-dependent methyltransferase [Shewanella sp. VB17]NRD74824.1 class I SAM-dependent methyltransferase [Shewanella sp. VB17]
MKWDLHYKNIRSKAPFVWPDINVIRLLSKSSLTISSNVLDLGCGEGRNIRALHELGINTIVAVDQSKYALNVVNKLYGIVPEQLFCTDISHGLPMLQSSKFDLVLCWGLMHYLTKPEDTLREIHRVLADNGSAILSFSSKSDQRETVDNVCNYYEQTQIETLMQTAGFNIKSLGKITDQFISDGKIESYYWLMAVKL